MTERRVHLTDGTTEWIVMTRDYMGREIPLLVGFGDKNWFVSHTSLGDELINPANVVKVLTTD